jgi:hypothetical protein
MTQTTIIQHFVDRVINETANADGHIVADDSDAVYTRPHGSDGRRCKSTFQQVKVFSLCGCCLGCIKDTLDPSQLIEEGLFFWCPRVGYALP